MTRRVTTASGAVYEFDGAGRVRRVNTDAIKRGDGEWQKLYQPMHELTVGLPMVIVLESLARYGEDDYGTPTELAQSFTTRVTTPVVSIEDRA